MLDRAIKIGIATAIVAIVVLISWFAVPSAGLRRAVASGGSRVGTRSTLWPEQSIV